MHKIVDADVPAGELSPLHVVIRNLGTGQQGEARRGIPCSDDDYDFRTQITSINDTIINRISADQVTCKNAKLMGLCQKKYMDGFNVEKLLRPYCPGSCAAFCPPNPRN